MHCCSFLVKYPQRVWHASTVTQISLVRYKDVLILSEMRLEEEEEATLEQTNTIKNFSCLFFHPL